VKQAYFNTVEFKQLLEQNDLDNFAKIWSLEADWFEAPNYRRNGWSGVIKYPLLDAAGKTSWVFIKRQENHNHKTLLHPFKGIPTFRREYHNILQLNKKNISTLSALYYNEHRVDAKHQSVLITLSLEGYQSMAQFCADKDNASIPQRSDIMSRAGILIRKLHDAHYRHNCLYAKHLFVKNEINNIDVRLIDLEKLKWLPLYSQIRRNDLSRIIRRGEPMNFSDLKKLLHSYYTSGTDLQKTSLAKELNTLLEKQFKHHENS